MGHESRSALRNHVSCEEELANCGSTFSLSAAAESVSQCYQKKFFVNSIGPIWFADHMDNKQPWIRISIELFSLKYNNVSCCFWNWFTFLSFFQPNMFWLHLTSLQRPWKTFLFYHVQLEGLNNVCRIVISRRADNILCVQRSFSPTGACPHRYICLLNEQGCCLIMF